MSNQTYTLLTKGQKKSFFAYGAKSKHLFATVACPYLKDIDNNECFFFKDDLFWPTDPNPSSTYKLMSLASNEQDFMSRVSAAMDKGRQIDPDRTPPPVLLAPITPITPMTQPSATLGDIPFNSASDDIERERQRYEQENAQLRKRLAELEQQMKAQSTIPCRCEELVKDISETQKKSILQIPPADLLEYRALIDPRCKFIRYLVHHPTPSLPYLAFQQTPTLQFSFNKATWLADIGQMAILERVFTSPSKPSKKGSVAQSQQFRSVQNPKIHSMVAGIHHSGTRSTSALLINSSSSTHEQSSHSSSDTDTSLTDPNSSIFHISFKFHLPKSSEANTLRKKKDGKQTKLKTRPWVPCIGICDATRTVSERVCFGNDSKSADFTTEGKCFHNKQVYPALSTWDSTSIASLELDMINRTVCFFVNGVRQNVLFSNIPEQVQVGAGCSETTSSIEIVSFVPLLTSSRTAAPDDIIIPWEDQPTSSF
ncbi:hypothetical protein BLNAU_23218 [Blattamonas nauphoetae]|uniref:B30.2/SPRY domain-containing protein n=1 Tax=Blattamonas nauphoetae TaxID=2049346 RepID=A0ABQ9WRB9_9EUKA|nr:hypothetical protein BLNAU_23218 [Blattamonas nauphoetae]